MLDTARPVAYIRRSVVSRSAPGDMSRQFQTEEVRRLAGDDGPALRVLDGDWGRSAATDKTEKRLAFLALMEAVERGEVTTIYAFSLDRLARSTEWSARLLNACEKAGTTIVTGEGRYAPGDEGARTTFGVLAVMNEAAVRQMSKKSKAVAALREVRGDVKGNPPYGFRFAARAKGEPLRFEPNPEQDVDAVLRAYEDVGSFNGAASRLNARGIPGPRGGRWYGSRVRDVLKAQRPDVEAVRKTTPRRAFGASGTAIFRRMLRCHCGGMLTPTIQRDKTWSYRCARGRVDRATHPVVQVPERAILEWAEPEAARLVGIEEQYRGADDEARRTALLARREGVAEALMARLITKEKAIEERNRIDDELDRLGAERVIVAVQSVDFDWSPVALHTALSALWHWIEMGPDLRPVRAEWTVPEWRAE